MNDWLRCAECKEPLHTDDYENDATLQCPKCGSTKRDSNVAVGTAAFGFRAYAPSVIIAPALSSILLQAVIELGPKIPEGNRIITVAPAWGRIIALLSKDPSAAFKIDPRKWEEIIAGAYEEAGFEEVILTPRSGDQGRDVIATKRALGKVRIIDQVKAYGPNHRVTADDVRALMGVLHCDGASKGFVTTTSTFAPGIKTDALIIPLIPQRLELIDGQQLLARLGELAGTTP